MLLLVVNDGHDIMVHFLQLLLQHVIFAEARNSVTGFSQYIFRHGEHDAHEVRIVETLKFQNKTIICMTAKIILVYPVLASVSNILVIMTLYQMTSTINGRGEIFSFCLVSFSRKTSNAGQRLSQNVTT